MRRGPEGLPFRRVSESNQGCAAYCNCEVCGFSFSQYLHWPQLPPKGLNLTIFSDRHRQSRSICLARFSRSGHTTSRSAFQRYLVFDRRCFILKIQVPLLASIRNLIYLQKCFCFRGFPGAYQRACFADLRLARGLGLPSTVRGHRSQRNTNMGYISPNCPLQS